MHSATEREAQLKAEAEEWAPPTDATSIPFATEAEVPVLDLGPYLAAAAAGRAEEAERAVVGLASQLRHSAEVGFFGVIGHGIPQPALDLALRATAEFHALPLSAKMEVAMDAPGSAVGGVGYLPMGNRKLPARSTPNQNAAFIVKRERGPRNVTLDVMPWPASHPASAFDGPAFRAAIAGCCGQLEALALEMLPIYARALQWELDEVMYNICMYLFVSIYRCIYIVLAPSGSLLLWRRGLCCAEHRAKATAKVSLIEQVRAAFRSPLVRLRASHYPPTPAGEFGIHPHVDTSFFTLLLTDDPTGLVVHSAARGAWVYIYIHTCIYIYIYI